jgi:Brp/Blh family beta-carotene 15,15'-monooxygenase
VTTAAVMPTSSSPAWSTLDRRVTVFCVATVAVVVGWALVDRTGLQSVSPAIAVVGIVIGIPHGAVDHLVPGLASRRCLGLTQRALVVGGYVLIAAVAALALVRARDLSLTIFFLVSALHFGWAETTYAAERGGDPVPRLRHGWLDAVVHGSVIVVLLLWSTEAHSALQPLVPTLLNWVSAVPTSWAVDAAVIVCGLAATRLVAQRRLIEGVELIAVLALFLIVPVLAAFGVYFGLWHAVRHTSRLMDMLGPGRPLPFQFKAFARAATLPTSAALIVLMALFASRSNIGVVMTGVSMLLALTFPHVVVVGVFDHYRRVGNRSPATDKPLGHRLTSPGA